MTNRTTPSRKTTSTPRSKPAAAAKKSRPAAAASAAPPLVPKAGARAAAKAAPKATLKAAAASNAHGLPTPAGTTNTATRGGRARPIGPEMIGFRLLKLTNLMSRPFFAQFAKHHALSLNEWRSIVVLATRPGSAAQDVAAATGLLPMNISRALMTLRKNGMVEEARDPDNHRRMLLWLTKRGEATFNQIAPHSQRDSRRLLGALTEAELALFGSMLDKLITRAEEISAEHRHTAAGEGE